VVPDETAPVALWLRGRSGLRSDRDSNGLASERGSVVSHERDHERAAAMPRAELDRRFRCMDPIHGEHLVRRNGAQHIEVAGEAAIDVDGDRVGTPVRVGHGIGSRAQVQRSSAAEHVGQRLAREVIRQEGSGEKLPASELRGSGDGNAGGGGLDTGRGEAGRRGRAGARKRAEEDCRISGAHTGLPFIEKAAGDLARRCRLDRETSGPGPSGLGRAVRRSRQSERYGGRAGGPSLEEQYCPN